MLTLETDDRRSEFLPGEKLRGTLSWQLASPSEYIVVQLWWYTSGPPRSVLVYRGERPQETQIVAEEKILSPVSSGTRRFEFTLPEGPYSFTGILMSMYWAISAAAAGEPGVWIPLILSPSRQSIQLYSKAPSQG